MDNSPSGAPLPGTEEPILDLPMPATLPDRLDKVAAALSRVALRHEVTPRSVDFIPMSAKGASPCDVHDRFFRVRRESGDSAELLAGALCQSDLRVTSDLAQSGTALSPDHHHMLLGVTWFLTGASPPATARQPWAPDDPFLAAQQRWMNGHQRFFILLQLLIIALKELESIRTPREELGSVHATAWLCRSTEAAMRYAADFPAALYEQVRDTMTPPAVNEGFSGLQTRDHQALVAQMRRFGNSHAAKRMSPVHYDVLHSGFAHLYRAHVHVCDKFTGGDSPSLRMAQGSADGATGVQAAADLAEQRLRLITRTEPASIDATTRHVSGAQAVSPTLP